MLVESTDGWVMAVVPLPLQANASVTFTVYVPEVSPETEAPCTPKGLQKYVYGSVPFTASAVRVPLLPPLLDTMELVKLTAMAAGCVIITVLMLWQPYASVTVAEKVPVDNPMAIVLVKPVGDQLNI